MKKLAKNFLCPFRICVFSNFEKIFFKSTQNFNKLYWNSINFIIINARFSQNSRNFFQVSYEFHSEFFSSFLRISFRIYLNSLKYSLKIFAAFIPENFPEIYTNFSKNFLKNSVRISIKFYLRITQILHTVYPKFPENYLLFVTNFHYNITPQHFHNQLIQVFCDCSSIFL